jgi:hypothetical protein
MEGSGPNQPPYARECPILPSDYLFSAMGQHTLLSPIELFIVLLSLQRTYYTGISKDQQKITPIMPMFCDNFGSTDS